MTRRLPRGPALALLLLAGPAAVPAPAVGVAAPKDGRPEVRSVTAVVGWDPATRTEHLILSVPASPGGPGFAILVPTPAEPKVEFAPGDVVGALAQLTAPETQKVRKRVFPRLGWPSLGGQPDVLPGPPPKPGGPAAPPAAKSETVPAGDPAKVAEWLAKAGYEADPALAAWLKSQADRKWTVTAVAVGGAAGSPVVRLTFPADRPVYPLRTVGAVAGSPPAHKVYVVSDGRYAGEAGGAPWAAAVAWSGPAKPEAVGPVVKAAEGSAPQNWWVTEFDDPAPGADEVVFAKAADQAAVARPPTVVYYLEDYPPAWVMNVLAAAGLVVVGLVLGRWLWRHRKAPAAASPPPAGPASAPGG
ncbi:MAG: hypothetical protein C0501_19115 [Isosphaera sp.]|nr:hypothetical protein [Isosphaera sp.]